jgi:hypothetical protein
MMNHVLLAERVQLIPHLVTVAAPSPLKDELGAGASNVWPFDHYFFSQFLSFFT